MFKAENEKRHDIDLSEANAYLVFTTPGVHVVVPQRRTKPLKQRNRGRVRQGGREGGVTLRKSTCQVAH